ncbi:MAG: 50S ribosomal protein L6 [Mycoplasmoidaceae bacterium]
MSRTGNRILEIPPGVSVDLNKNFISVKNNNEFINIPFNEKIINIINDNSQIKVIRRNDEKFSKMLHGTINANINNALIGLSKGHEKNLKILGVGYKANIVNDSIDLYLGHSHNIKIKIPNGISVVCKTPTEISIKGYDKAIVGQLAAVIRSKRPPEPYKGKGVMYIDEHIIRKAGKTADKK